MKRIIRKSRHAVNRRWYYAILAALVELILQAAALSAANAQTINLNPTCGMPGSSVDITGTSWQEEQPLCHYNFLFDGAPIAAPQEDSSFGPPNATAAASNAGKIPMGATNGPHTIKIELRDDDSNRLIQCKQDCFRVVPMSADPFNAGNNITTNGNQIDIYFDPTNACDVSKCSKLVAIQVLQPTGTTRDGKTTRGLTFTEQGFDSSPQDHAAQKDKDIINGYVLDYLWGENAPYYNSSYKGVTDPDEGVQSCDMTPKKSHLHDGPGRSPSAFPVNPTDHTQDITTITLNFEVNFFCAEGDDAGKYFGQVTWHFTDTLENAQMGKDGTTTRDSFNRNQPTANFINALNWWSRKTESDGTTPAPHPFDVPTTMPPTTGGTACN